MQDEYTRDIDTRLHGLELEVTKITTRMSATKSIVMISGGVLLACLAAFFGITQHNIGTKISAALVDGTIETLRDNARAHVNKAKQYEEEAETYKDGASQTARNIADLNEQASHSVRDIIDLKSTYFPQGIIVMWKGAISSIPDGWTLCDGTNGTPNLADKFISGASGEDDIGKTSGSFEHEHYISKNYLAYGCVGDENCSDELPDDTKWEQRKWRTPVLMTENEVFLWANWDQYYEPDNNLELGISGMHVQLQGDISTEVTSNVPPYFKLAFIMRM